MDSLRYWVLEMHVDGFRFDLASTLAREFYDVDRLATFFELVQQDPVVSQVKLIAEPWDVGPGGYQVGNFPPQWTEWNGKYRDTVRDFWRGEPSTLGEFASRLTGSADLYEHSGRRPGRVHQLRHRPRRLHAARPGLLQREAQRGQRRGQQRRRVATTARGTAASKGPTDDPAVLDAARPPAAQLPRHAAAVARACRCSLHGDELGRTQQGNNNGYAPGQRAHLGRLGQSSTSRCIEFTAARRPAAARAPDVPPAPVLRRAARCARGEGEPVPDIVWLPPDGTPMQPEDWDTGFGRCDRRLPQRRTASASATAAGSRSPTSTSSCCSTPTTSRSTSRFRRASSARSGTSSSTPPASRPDGRDAGEPASTVDASARRRR